MSISASEARRRLFPLIEEVNDNAEAVEIVSKAGSAYLVPAAEYEAWKTTMHLFAAPANARHLLESYQEAIAGRVEPRELVEPNALEVDEAEIAHIPASAPLLARMDTSELEKLSGPLHIEGRVKSGSFTRSTEINIAHDVVMVHVVPILPSEMPEVPDTIADLHLVVGDDDSEAR